MVSSRKNEFFSTKLEHNFSKRNDTLLIQKEKFNVFFGQRKWLKKACDFKNASHREVPYSVDLPKRKIANF
jgi:hypothetical protein